MSHATVLRPLVNGDIPGVSAADHARLEFLAGYDGNTRAAYALDLRILFGWAATIGRDPLQLTRHDLEAFVAHLVSERGNSAVTIKRRVAAVRKFYRLAVHDGLIAKSPADFVRVPRPAPVLELDLGLNRSELAAILAAARASRPVDAALVALLGLMGLRVAEACGLDVADAAGVHADHRVLRFTGKGNKPAIAPIAPPVWRLLAPMLAGRVHGPLLMRPSGAGLNRVAAARIVNRLAAAAGIDRHITPHDLRRGYISGLLDAGVALRDAQQAARHSDPRMTALYDRARRSLDRHGNYALASWIAGAG